MTDEEITALAKQHYAMYDHWQIDLVAFARSLIAAAPTAIDRKTLSDLGYELGCPAGIRTVDWLRHMVRKAQANDSGECVSCVDGKCVTGKNCVTLGRDSYQCGYCKDTGYLPDGNHCQWCAVPLDKEAGKSAAQAPFVGMDREWTPEEKQGMSDALRQYGWCDGAPSVAQDERKALESAYEKYCGRSHSADLEKHEAMALDYEAGWQSRALLAAIDRGAVTRSEILTGVIAALKEERECVIASMAAYNSREYNDRLDAKSDAIDDCIARIEHMLAVPLDKGASEPVVAQRDALNAVAADIAAMTAEELRTVHESHRNGDIAVALRELSFARALLADDARDAARYRWLRNEHFPTANNPPLAQVVWKFLQDRHCGRWVNIIDGNDLDFAIDEAMDSAKPGKDS